eukprot:TRINITY_DN3674_c2_g1_i1.p1 TRINITY_DN3674_c2_g1~~TRINITY_DN3674_c2_g1_i1.p1  ORF type:complete len:102 (+),score=5.32 TRINITY_DN3674_c2_g1_i1:1112-1417(+)
MLLAETNPVATPGAHFSSFFRVLLSVSLSNQNKKEHKYRSKTNLFLKRKNPLPWAFGYSIVKSLNMTTRPSSKLSFSVPIKYIQFVPHETSLSLVGQVYRS